MFKTKKQKKLKILFMGTTDLASIVLESLINNNYNISAVITQPDYIQKNGKESIVSPVKTLALEKNIKILQPEKIDNDFIDEIKELSPDIIIVVAYGKILPEKILNIPKFKSINIHASILPKLRGPSPIQNAILQDLQETGTTIMLMDKGVDTGDILAQKTIKIQKTDNYLTLTSKLAVLSANLLEKTLPKWIAGKIKGVKQNENEASMCQLIERSDGKINWSNDANHIFNKFRAFHIWPGIYTFWENKNIIKKISLIDIEIRDDFLSKKYHPGEVFKYKNHIAVQTGRGIVIIKKIQLEGKKKVSINDFLNGYPNFIGTILK